MRRIQRIQPSPHVQGRYLVFFEGEKLLKVTEDEMLRFSLCAGLTLEEDTYAELTCCASRSQAMSAAARIIGSRALSKGELVDKLTQKGHSRENAQAAADYMEEIGALNDGQYAKILARHYAGRGYGTRKIQSELYRRKVPRTYWEDALSEVETPEDVLDRLIEKKLRNKVPDRKELGKVSAFLARRGFSWSEIQEGLSRYTDAQDEFEPYP